MWDAFISHASEDKDALVDPLARALASFGADVWYDKFTLKPGESLSRSIDKGLANSRHGIVVLSPHFIAKPWPERELSGLVTMQLAEGRSIIPIWHNIKSHDVRAFSPP